MSEAQIETETEFMELPEDCVAHIARCVSAKGFINSLLGLCQNKYAVLNILGRSSNIIFTENKMQQKLDVLTADLDKIDCIKSLDFYFHCNLLDATWTKDIFIGLLDSVALNFERVVIPLFINRNVYFSGCINIDAKFYSYFRLSHLTHKMIELRDKLSRMFTAVTHREIDFVIRFTNKSHEYNWGNMDTYWDEQRITLYHDHADLVNWVGLPENPHLDVTLSHLRKFMTDFPDLKYVHYVDALENNRRNFNLDFDERNQTLIVIENNKSKKEFAETFYLSYLSELNLFPFMSVERRFKDMFLSTGKIHLQNGIFMFLWDEKRYVSHYDYLDFIHLYMIENEKIVLHDKDNCIITLGLSLATYLCHELVLRIRTFLATVFEKLELEEFTLVFYMIHPEGDDEIYHEWYTIDQIKSFIQQFDSNVVKKVHLHHMLYRRGEYGDLNETNVSALKKRFL